MFFENPREEIKKSIEYSYYKRTVGLLMTVFFIFFIPLLVLALLYEDGSFILFAMAIGSLFLIPSAVYGLKWFALVQDSHTYLFERVKLEKMVPSAFQTMAFDVNVQTENGRVNKKTKSMFTISPYSGFSLEKYANRTVIVAHKSESHTVIVIKIVE